MVELYLLVLAWDRAVLDILSPLTFCRYLGGKYFRFRSIQQN
jgi:hypothetical protein